MISPSSINAIGPPTAASGETCPMDAPRLAPEKRPSVLEKIQKNKASIQAKTAEKKLPGQER